MDEGTGCFALRKHAYSNILKLLQTKNGKFSDKKKSDIFHISAQKHRLWVLVRTTSPRIRKNNVYPCKPQFYCIKWGLRRSILYRHVFVMGLWRVFCLICFVNSSIVDTPGHLRISVSWEKNRPLFIYDQHEWKYMSRNERKRTFWHMRPTKTQISRPISAMIRIFVVRLKTLCILGCLTSWNMPI